ncbi:hypothetical protein C6V83_14725 [Gordonia iterans]|uniref:Uncharacterized protein n=1 Tax=Gordonia iterans TaxID=1004901 RepID=A0A2S0KI06_9ACTN|nr:hypothetical protein C6V83_14725 [Gordonia iterans]
MRAARYRTALTVLWSSFTKRQIYATVRTASAGHRPLTGHRHDIRDIRSARDNRSTPATGDRGSDSWGCRVCGRLSRPFTECRA